MFVVQMAPFSDELWLRFFRARGMPVLEGSRAKEGELVCMGSVMGRVSDCDDLRIEA